jgi:hypothetical protein
MKEYKMSQGLAGERRYFDNTILNDYRKCPRLYFLRHVKGWRKEGIALPLVFGLAWHSAMDVIWQHYHTQSPGELIVLASAAFDQVWVEQGMPEPATMGLEEIEKYGQRTPMVAKEMLIAYVAARLHILENAKLIAPEQPFAVPLPADPTAPGSTWYAGRLDKVIDYTNSKLVVEHKTTTEYKIDGGFKTNYLQGWYLDSQIMGYLYGGGLFFEGLSQVWVDAALVHKKVRAFKFLPIDHQWSMLEQWVRETQEWVNRIYNDEESFKVVGKLGNGVFPKNSDSCYGKFGPCQMVDICRSTPDPSQLSEPPAGFKYDPWSPFDILKLDKLLTEKP